MGYGVLDYVGKSNVMDTGTPPSYAQVQGTTQPPPEKSGLPPAGPGMMPVPHQAPPPPQQGLPPQAYAQQQMAVQQQIFVQHPVMFGPHSMQVMCGYCHQTVQTTTESNLKSSAILLATLLCLVGGILCCWIPCVMDSSYETTHRCPACKATLGIYNA
ncbi:unnamed protein product [Clavelina lepadiformis]|uniref:LITAF domain-containing protein n=1 Tax=Clavelina lepadiformis TaxID=159417 RepID=A0ABP0GI95_CLALP